MKNPLWKYLVFTKRERKGALILIAFVVAALLTRVYFQWEFFNSPVANYVQLEQQLAMLTPLDTVAEEANAKIAYQKTESVSPLQDAKNQIPHDLIIDPNTASKSDFQKLGLSAKQAQVVLNYRDKGGLFRKKEDFKKMYVIDDDLYAQLEGHLQIAQKTNFIAAYKKEQPVFKKEKPKTDSIYKPKPKPKIELASVDINTADTTQLKMVPGIGSYYAKCIVKDREMLGGYSNLDQLYQVYGLKNRPENVDKILPYLKVSSVEVVQIPINSCAVEQLAHHPYINWNVAKALVNYRKRHGQFQELYDITKSDLVDDELYSKIAPYLKLDDN